jgi:hypothetical protein
MEHESMSEMDCKRKCDVDAQECREGGVHSDECENQWDSCMSECLDEGDVFS